MYIKKLIDENIGPIEQAQIVFPFNQDGTPKPVIIVGENGSGKSTLLSNIVDALYLLADKAYDNAMIAIGSGGKQYYKAIMPAEIKTGKNYMFSYLELGEESEISYIFKSGQITNEELQNKTGNKNISATENNYKSVQATDKKANEAFEKGIVCNFGANRYEKPFWLGKEYISSNDYMHPSIMQNLSRRLKSPISIYNVVETNTQWLLDVIVDSRPDVIFSNGSWRMRSNFDNVILHILQSSRNNLEQILSEIIGKEVTFSLNYRSVGTSRFSVLESKTGKTIAPTFDSLSTGQIVLFNMFSTIVRYADNNNINRSANLEEISGIVLIDEIELHLHTKLQKEVLPKLIKLFPKVQFIITTHSPLFLLGMQEHFGDDGFEIYNMPDAKKIDVERFSEFQRAYEYFKNTDTYQRETEENVKNAISEIIKKDETETLLITEGATDWKHIKTAYSVLSQKPENKELFDNFDFKFLEYVPVASGADNEMVIEMGNASLCNICESYAKIPNRKKYIFIADRDDEKTNKKLSESGKKYKNWGNNVYSFVLPVPDHRKTTPNICIEHLYSDNEIKKEIECDGIKRRLYMGCEFDDRGVACSIDRFCEKRNSCGSGKIQIIEGSSGGRVTCLSNDNGTNYALPKMDFANYVADHKEEFNFDSFLEIFKIIKEILSEGETNA